MMISYVTYIIYQKENIGDIYMYALKCIFFHRLNELNNN